MLTSITQMVYSMLMLQLLELKCTRCLMFCNSSTSSNYAYKHNAGISGNTFTVFSPNFPADYDSGTGFQWESESKCLLNVTNLPKHETLMIDMLHKSQGHVSNCDTPLPFSVLDDQMVELELHTVCPTNIGGTDRKRAITFTKSGEIAELQLILRKSNEGKAFQVYVRTVMLDDIELMKDKILSSMPLTAEQSFLMSHRGLGVEAMNSEPSEIQDGNYSVRLNITQQQGFKWHYMYLYVDIIYLNLTNRVDYCNRGSHLVFADGDKTLLCAQNNTNPIHYLPLTSQHGYTSPYIDFKLNLWQQDTPKRGFILYYKVVKCRMVPNSICNVTSMVNVCQFDCDSGYSLTNLTEKTEFTCDINGDWQPHTPECVLTDPELAATETTTSSLTSESSQNMGTKSFVSKMEAFFDKKTNIIIVTSVGVGPLLLVLLIVIVVKLRRNERKSRAAESSKSKSGDNAPQHDNGYDHIENIPGISVETIVEIKRTSHVDQTENNWDPTAMNLTDSNAHIGSSEQRQAKKGSQKYSLRYTNMESIEQREKEEAIEDMYAPIQKQMKQDIKVDLVDNDLYGSTDD